MSSTSATEPFLGRDDRPPGLTRVASGKVRDVYELDAEHLLFVTTDRVSAFDVVMDQGIAGKGRVLTAVSAWWFAHTGDLVPNHFVTADVDALRGFGLELPGDWVECLRGRIMVVRRAVPTTVEWVVRGYLAGSGWKEYRADGAICGQRLPEGLRLADRLPEPLLTPTTKDEAKDRPLGLAEARERVGAELFARAREAAFALFRRGTEVLAQKGFLLADTKFEFGTIDGELVLIDEALTPDSSRFWLAESWRPGSEPPSWDKQVLRTWLEAQDWNKSYPPPRLSADVIARVAERYFDICERITGRSCVAGARS